MDDSDGETERIDIFGLGILEEHLQISNFSAGNTRFHRERVAFMQSRGSERRRRVRC